MKEKLTNNWILKLISIVLAIFLWIFVIYEDNPIESKRLTIDTVKYLNEDVVLTSGKTYSVQSLDSKGVEITVQVRKQDSAKVRSEDFQAVVDLAQVGPYGYAEVKVEWKGSPDYTLHEDDISWKTTTVLVTLEDIIEQTYTVRMKISGDPASSYIVGEHGVSPRTVKIKAPKSVLEQIRSVGIEVDISGMNSEVTGTTQLKLYDVTGAELKLNYEEFAPYEFSISHDEVTYAVPLLKIKEVVVQTNGYTGEVAEGYRYTGMEGATQTAYIAGLKAVLADVDGIDIPAEVLNLEGATGNVEIQVDLSKYVPEGVTVESNKIVTITLLVEQLKDRTIQLDAEQIRMEGGLEGWEYTLKSKVPVTVQGLQEDLNTLKADMLDAWISLDYLEPGENTVEMNVTVGSGFEVIRIGEAVVTMVEIPATEESTEETEEGETGEGTSGGNTGEGSEDSGDTEADATVESTEGNEDSGEGTQEPSTEESTEENTEESGE